LHGAARFDEAGRALEDNLEMRRRILGELDDDTLGALQGYISWLDHVGRREDAIARAREAVEVVERGLGAQHEWTIAFKSTLALALPGKVQHPDDAERAVLEGEALPLLEEVVAWRRVHEPDAPATLTALHNLAQTYWRLDRFDDAEPLLRESVAGLERTLGPRAPGTMIATGTLGSLLQSAQRFDEARETYERAHAGLCEAWGARHPESLVLAYNLAYLERDRGRLEAAERWAREAADGRREVLGPDNALALRATWQHAEILRELGRRDEARELYRGLLDSARDSLAPDDQRIVAYQRGYDACAVP
jgi:tetratricopeptide (TPR) repeat protein